MLSVRKSKRDRLNSADDNSRSGNDTDADDADIKPIYDKEMVEILSRMEAHVCSRLKYQNQALKSGQHGQILNETSNKAKIEKEIDVLEIMNIELGHNLKIQNRLNLCLTNNAELKAQIQEKGFAIAALKNDLRKLKKELSVCVFKQNHDVLYNKTPEGSKFVVLKIQSHKTRNSNKPVDQKSHTQKPGRQILLQEHRKVIHSCTSKVDSEPPHGSNVDIPNIHECKQTLDVSAGSEVYTLFMAYLNFTLPN
ncbi:hypothetical protein Tco_1420233 [Tanacetum coccineum]